MTTPTGAETAVLETDSTREANPEAGPAPIPTAPPSRPIATARRPVAAPAASSVGVVLAVGLIAAGVVVGRDVLIRLDAVTGSPWLPPAVDWVDGLTAQQWMLPAGIGAVVVGVLLLVAAVRPRRRTHRPVAVDGVWIRDRDVLTLARRAAEDCGGVGDVSVRGGSRKVKVTAVAASGVDESAVRTAVESSLSLLAAPPRVKVKIRTEGAA